MPLFSVVIPTYNRANLIEAAVESVLNQEYTDYELLVIDDGSTDNTMEVLAKYGEKVHIIRQENAGPSSARNRGISLSSGTYLTFLDSDDRWFPWTLDIYRRMIEQYDHPAGLLGSRFDFSNDTEVNGISRLVVKSRHYEDVFSTHDNEKWFGTPVSVIRKELVQGVGGFRSKTECFEDLDLWLRLGDAPGLVEIEHPYTLAYRQHSDAITLRASKFRMGALAIIGSEISNEYPGGAKRRFERRAIIARLGRGAASTLARRGWAKYALDVYWADFREQVRRQRWKYLAGLPLLVSVNKLRGRRQTGRE